MHSPNAANADLSLRSPSELIAPTFALPSSFGNASDNAFVAASPGIFSSAYRALSHVSGLSSSGAMAGTSASVAIG